MGGKRAPWSPGGAVVGSVLRLSPQKMAESIGVLQCEVVVIFLFPNKGRPTKMDTTIFEKSHVTIRLASFSREIK